MDNKLSSTKRFSDRVENYAKYRPIYPSKVIEIINQEIALNSGTKIADIGSGTGIFTKLLLETGAEVTGVEPNREMREYAEKMLQNFPGFISNSGTAENTGIESNFIDLITVAQAFHWFDRDKTKAEMKRIIKENGYLLLIWNDRKIVSGTFSQEYEQLVMELCPEYKEVTHKNIDDKQIDVFYLPFDVKKFMLANIQEFDFEGLKGRLMSSSYVPINDKEITKKILKRLEEIFNKHNKDGKVSYEYETTAYFGRI